MVFFVFGGLTRDGFAPAPPGPELCFWAGGSDRYPGPQRPPFRGAMADIFAG